MKLFAFFFFLVPLAVVGQTKLDYEHAMAKFQTFYNAGQGDSVSAMFGYKEDYVWTNKNNALRLEEFGTLKSFKFIGIDTADPNKVWVFKTTFSKGGVKTTSLTLDKNKHLDTFRFITESDGITELLKKDKSK
jgi:hypothetical protein